MDIHYITLFDTRNGFTSAIVACDLNVVNPNSPFISTTRLEDVTCLDCFKAMHKS